jgi:hypothetical protein
MKITSYRFYSPDGVTNHVIGVLPTLVISQENTAAVAALLASPQPSRADGMLKLELAGLTFYLDPTQAVASSRAAFIELLEALPPSATLYQGSGLNSWSATTPAKVAKKLGLSLTLRTFSDIASSPFRQEIETLAAYQLLSGYDDGAFHPGAAITRAEFCAMVATALNLPANEKALTFTDTTAGAWYADAVSAMAAKGFISGYGDGTFRPNATITYEEMVTILASVAAWSSMDGDALIQEGVPASESGQYLQYSSWAQVPARTLGHLNALVGDLAPSDNGTRQVAAGMLCSLMENIHLLWD